MQQFCRQVAASSSSSSRAQVSKALCTQPHLRVPRQVSIHLRRHLHRGGKQTA